MGGKRPRDGEDKFLQLSDEITYSLWVGEGRKTVKKRGQRTRDGEDVFLQLSVEITYELLVGKGGETLRTCFCSYSMGSRTACGWERSERR